MFLNCFQMNVTGSVPNAGEHARRGSPERESVPGDGTGVDRYRRQIGSFLRPPARQFQTADPDRIQNA